TEATVWSSVARLKRGEKVTIGHPIPGATIYILDEHMALVEQGQAGEIYVGGPGVSRGYLNRPDATKLKFVSNPFGDSNETLYRTGDLGRFLSDGSLEFLGRVDNQVKIRGFRIELEEVESVLASQPGVLHAVVNPHAVSPSDKCLVAYIVPSGAVDIKDLRQRVKQRLPEHMVPSSVVVMDKLPLMPNGKVDRSALPAPQPENDRADSCMAPRTPSEEQIAAIWKELLKREHIGVDENFFELGGHSLLAIQVMARMRQLFQIEMPLKDIFEAPTIAGLAERLFEHLVNSEAGSGQVPSAEAGKP
ncbi:MAG: non-ribosomal peptide synthetase, partial [Limisphaerales bacterium]